jgi:ketosteroid isomerase-like protein
MTAPGARPRESVKLVCDTFDALARHDYQRAIRGFHADAVWRNTAQFPGPKSCTGPAAIIDFWRTLTEPFEESVSSSGIEQVADGGDRVALGVHSVGRGRASGLPIDVRWGAVFRVREGKIATVDVYGDWAAALDAAGVED